MIWGAALAPLEWALKQYERTGGRVGVEQFGGPVFSFAALESQPIAHRAERLVRVREKLREPGQRADVSAPRDSDLRPSAIAAELTLG